MGSSSPQFYRKTHSQCGPFFRGQGQQEEDPSRGHGLKVLFHKQGPVLSSESHILDSLLRKFRFDAGGGSTGDPTWGKCPKCSDVFPIASCSYVEGLGAPDKARLWVEVGDDLEYVRCDATFSVLSLTPPRILLNRPLVARKL